MFGRALLSLPHLCKEFIVIHLLHRSPLTKSIFDPLFLPSSSISLGSLHRLSSKHPVVLLELLVLLLTGDDECLPLHQDVEVRLLPQIADGVQDAEGERLEAVTQTQAEGRRDLLEHRDVPEDWRERRVVRVVVT